MRREKKKYQPRDYNTLVMDEEKYKIVDESQLKLKLSTLKRWQENELLLPNDEHYDLKSLLYSWCKPDTMYSCVSKKLGLNDAKKGAEENRAASPSPSFVSESHSDFVLTMRTDTQVSVVAHCLHLDVLTDTIYFCILVKQPLLSDGAGPSSAYDGAKLVDQPYTVEQINIPFAKYAKKIDVRLVKRCMLDVIDSQNDDAKKTAQPDAPTPAEVMGDLASGGGGDMPDAVSIKYKTCVYIKFKLTNLQFKSHRTSSRRRLAAPQLWRKLKLSREHSARYTTNYSHTTILLRLFWKTYRRRSHSLSCCILLTIRTSSFGAPKISWT